MLWKLNRLGELWQLRGDYAVAEPLLRSALAHRGERRGVEYPYLARTLNSLAALNLDRGDCAEASAFYRVALELRRDVLGNEHPDVAQSLANLGRALWLQDDRATAEPLLREGLTMQRRLLGDDHPQVVRQLRELALLGQSDPRAGALLAEMIASADLPMFGGFGGGSIASAFSDSQRLAAMSFGSQSEIARTRRYPRGSRSDMGLRRS